MKNVEKVTWELETDDEGVIRSTYAGFKKVLDDRRKLFKSVMSLIIHGVPVTQPKSNETYHIIEIKIGENVVLELLFRQSDNYWIAFRHVSTEGNPVWEGWYYFKDKIVLPSFCEQKIKIDIESGYTDFMKIRIGIPIVSDVIKCLLAFDLKNYASESFGVHNRVLLLQTLMVLFGECQRSGVFLDFAEKHFESVNSVPVNLDLSKHRNSWSNLSTALLTLYLGFLEQKHDVHGWEATVDKGVEQMTREVREFTNLGHFDIDRFIEYEATLDEEGKKVPKFTPESMQNLLGSDVGELLHLIKYDEKVVLEIHLAMMKMGMDWP